MKARKILLLILCVLIGRMVSAHDFSVTINGQRLFFEITSKSNRTASVTYNGSISSKKDPEIAGMIEIPAKVRHDNVVYSITAIGQKAFANSKKLKGIVIPAGVETIGDFAFENCDSLNYVVFPGNKVALGQGIFYNCKAISDVSLGSDWKSIDLSMFRWSRTLKSLTIPAKIEKITGVKKLKYLAEINVDKNNGYFWSSNGILYNKDKTILYACPRMYKATIKIVEGTLKIQDGALIDCLNTVSIDFPSSLKYVSFRETSRMNSLTTLVMRSDRPINTGYLNGKGKFFFVLLNPKTLIAVKSSSKKYYIENLATEAGEYSDVPQGVPFMVHQNELPTKKNFNGVKKFDKI